MPGPLAGIALVIASFLIGAIPWGYVAGKASRGIDLRTVGSGGTGATNVLRTAGTASIGSRGRARHPERGAPGRLCQGSRV